MGIVVAMQTDEERRYERGRTVTFSEKYSHTDPCKGIRPHSLAKSIGHVPNKVRDGVYRLGDRD
jgi:hypothetical protein